MTGYQLRKFYCLESSNHARSNIIVNKLYRTMASAENGLKRNVSEKCSSVLSVIAILITIAD